jgi:hypothetical protein
MKARGPGIAFSAVVVLVPAIAGAALCGDDVGGRDVPCACGDTVVSDLALGDDPVTNTVCPGDGLVVRAPEATKGVTTDLRGKTLRGSGTGAGLLVVYGGPGGASIVSSHGDGTVENFRDGVLAHGPNTVRLIEDVEAKRSLRDGFNVSGDGFEIRGAEARESRRDGYAVRGKRYRLDDTRAEDSGRFGYRVAGQDAVVGDQKGNESDGSGGAGFSVRGKRHRVNRCSASGARKSGVELAGSRHDVRRCTVSENGGDGIRGSGGDWIVADNRAVDNEGAGIAVAGPRVRDVGGNSARRNRGFGRLRREPQCIVGGRACR